MHANDNAAWDARKMQAELAVLIHAYPELADDPDLAADTFEGVGLNDVLSRLVGAAQDAKFTAAAVADRVGELQQRKSRFERRNEAMRTLLLKLLQQSGLPRVVLPEATVSIGKGATAWRSSTNLSCPSGRCGFRPARTRPRSRKSWTPARRCQAPRSRLPSRRCRCGWLRSVGGRVVAMTRPPLPQMRQLLLLCRHRSSQQTTTIPQGRPAPQHRSPASLRSSRSSQRFLRQSCSAS